MAVNMQGMDVGEVQRIGRQMQVESDNLGQLLARVRNQVSVAEQNWHGSDASHFVDEWASRQQQLQTLQDSLRRFGQRAVDEAAQQSRASGTATA